MQGMIEFPLEKGISEDILTSYFVFVFYLKKNLILKIFTNYTGEDIYGMGTENTGFLL